MGRFRLGFRSSLAFDMKQVIVALCLAGVCLAQYGGYSQSSASGYNSGNSRFASATASRSSSYQSGGFGSGTSSFGSQYSSAGRSPQYGSSVLRSGQISGGYSAGGSQYGRRGGYSQDNSEPARYEFKYDVNQPEYGVEFGHQEQRDGDNTDGAYYVLLPDGRRQLVEYTVDSEGYHPRISYTESSSSGRSGNYGSAGGYQSGRRGQSGGYQSGRSGQSSSGY